MFGDVDNASPLAQTETFGPVVSLIRFSDEAEAVRIANDTPYGLNAFVQTRDLTGPTVFRAAGSGSVWINQFSDISPQGPYGGYKQSGFGRTGGLDGLHEFLQIKNIRIGRAADTRPVRSGCGGSASHRSRPGGAVVAPRPRSRARGRVARGCR